MLVRQPFRLEECTPLWAKAPNCSGVPQVAVRPRAFRDPTTMGHNHDQETSHFDGRNGVGHGYTPFGLGRPHHSAELRLLGGAVVDLGWFPTGSHKPPRRQNRQGLRQRPDREHMVPRGCQRRRQRFPYMHGPRRVRPLLPLINIVDVEAKSDNVTPGAVRKILAGLDVKKGSSNLTVTLDGKEIGPNVIQYEESPFFAVTLPQHNIFSSPAGVYDPCADNGYYALIRGTTPGEHTLKFTGAYEGTLFKFSINATYHLTITG